MIKNNKIMIKALKLGILYGILATISLNIPYGIENLINPTKIVIEENTKILKLKEAESIGIKIEPGYEYSVQTKEKVYYKKGFFYPEEDKREILSKGNYQKKIK